MVSFITPTVPVMIIELDVDDLRYVGSRLEQLGPAKLEAVTQKFVNQIKAKHHAALVQEIREFFEAVTVKAALVAADTTTAQNGNVLPIIKLRIEIPDSFAGLPNHKV